MVLVGDHPRKSGVKVDDGRILGTARAQTLGEACESLVFSLALGWRPLCAIRSLAGSDALTVHLGHLAAYLLGDASAFRRWQRGGVQASQQVVHGALIKGQ